MSCISTTQCIAFDTKGVAVLFDPHQPSNTTSTQFDRGQEIIASDCESTSECTVIDAAGGELTSPPPGQNNGANQPTRYVVDATQTLTGLSCPASNHCVVTNGEGKAINFDPTTGRAGSPALTDAIPAYAAVACSSPSQCTGADRGGDIVTFNPQTRAVLAGGTVDPGTQLVTAIACPSASVCTLVDLDGREVSFNPRSPANVTGKQLVTGHPLLAVSCPTAGQCTTVDDDRDEITFNPSSPGGATYALLGTPSGTSINGISCPTAGQCTAIDGSGEAVTFNPAAPGSPKPHTILANGAADITCPTTQECVAVDPSGGQAVFNPAAPATAHVSTIDAGQQTGGLACLTGTYCVIIDSAGHAVEFDPHASGATASLPVGSPASVTGIACPSGTECVAVDTGGHAFAARGALPPLPVGTGSPGIRGRAAQAVKLTTSTGHWTNAPTSYAIQWQRCTAHAKACHAINGATARSYRLAAADVGHRLRVRVLAANQAGYSGRAKYSKLTGVVVSRPMPPAVSRLTLSTSSFGFTLTAARYGPKLRTVLIALPAGVYFNPRQAGKALAVTSGRRLRVGARTAGGRLRIALPRTVRTVRIVLRAPKLTLSGALARRLQARRVSALTLRVSLTGPGSHNLRTTKRWKAK
jgi:hypothetical protein